ncbi:hypothetical protein BX666DRAFT_2003465, partial [Dichotomocladium elegans]
MSLDVTNLSILSVAGTPEQKACAAKIMPIRKDGHLVLTVLLLTNTVLNETLPVLCDDLFGKGTNRPRQKKRICQFNLLAYKDDAGYIAIILSTALIVLFSEIIPQAICSRNGLAIGAFFAFPVKGLIGFWYIIAWPIAKMLDLLLGKHQGTMYIVPELVELIGLHSSTSEIKGPLEQLTADLLQSILLLSEKSAGDFLSCINMTNDAPRFMIHADTNFDSHLMEQILKSGCTAVPVYEHAVASSSANKALDEKHDTSSPSSSAVLIGILRTSSLVYPPAKETLIPVRNLELEPVFRVPPTLSAVSLLQILQNESSHIVQVVQEDGLYPDRQEELPYSNYGSRSSILKNKYTPMTDMGIVSLQDVLMYLFRGSSEMALQYDTRISIDNRPWKLGSMVNRSSTTFSNTTSATAISK